MIEVETLVPATTKLCDLQIKNISAIQFNNGVLVVDSDSVIFFNTEGRIPFCSENPCSPIATISDLLVELDWGFNSDLITKVYRNVKITVEVS